MRFPPYSFQHSPHPWEEGGGGQKNPTNNQEDQSSESPQYFISSFHLSCTNDSLGNKPPLENRYLSVSDLGLRGVAIVRLYRLFVPSERAAAPHSQTSLCSLNWRARKGEGWRRISLCFCHLFHALLGAFCINGDLGNPRALFSSACGGFSC